MEKSLNARLATTAESMCERIEKLISNFEKNLADDEVAALSLASASGMTIVITKLGYWNPDLIILYGRDPRDGEAVKLIQHVSQVSLLLVPIKRPQEMPEEEIQQARHPRRIGFVNEEG